MLTHFILPPASSLTYPRWCLFSLQNLPLRFFTCLSVPQHVCWKREKSRWEQGNVPENSLNRTYHIGFLTQREMHVKSLLKPALWPSKKYAAKYSTWHKLQLQNPILQKAENVLRYFWLEERVFALNIKGKTLLSVLIGDPGEQDIKEDCCCPDLRKEFF